MSKITTHVLDTALGRPAKGVKALLDFRTEDGWQELAKGVTNDDGRIANLLGDGEKLKAGIYRLSFETKSYFDGTMREGFYPYIAIVFEVEDAAQHYHVPLLLSPYGYSTYRGS